MKAVVGRVKRAEYGYFTCFSNCPPFLPLLDAPRTGDALTRVRIVLVQPSHPGNIGASARAMLTMGITRLVLVAPLHFPDPDATARASGADAVLADARVVSTLAEALAGCVFSIGLSGRAREFAGRVLPLREVAPVAISRIDAGDVALVFGTEMSGLSNAELAQCEMVATIPANPEFASLNLAAAVQLAAYELRLAAGLREVWTAPRFAPASHDEIESLYGHARSTLTDLRFLDPARPRRLLPRLRRLFGRAALEREEVNILRGILARIDQLTDKSRP